VAFLLNYVPILGTALGVVIFLLAGLLTIDTLWQALLPAGLLPWISFDRRRDRDADASGRTVHPQSRPRHHLARLLVLDVGIPGMILSMLAIAKIVCDRVRPLASFGHFLEGQNPADFAKLGGNQIAHIAKSFRTSCFILPLDLWLVVQNHIQQRIVDFQFSVVFDKTQLAEFVHKKTNA
jgi:hypothetical protein